MSAISRGHETFAVDQRPAVRCVHEGDALDVTSCSLRRDWPLVARPPVMTAVGRSQDAILARNRGPTDSRGDELEVLTRWKIEGSDRRSCWRLPVTNQR